MTDDLLMRAWIDQAPDLIVRDPGIGGCIAAEVLGIPHATVAKTDSWRASVWADQSSDA